MFDDVPRGFSGERKAAQALHSPYGFLSHCEGRVRIPDYARDRTVRGRAVFRPKSFLKLRFRKSFE
jgi:hypothetical protein